MEVHHHPEVEKKGLKEYVLEGMMIFIAVTMGFFAETIREGISDRSKGKEYIRSFVQDLQTDTANFSVLIAFDEKKVTVLNNLPACYDSVRNDNHASACLVPIIGSSMSNREVSFTDGTLQQLKNAGGFRFLKRSDKDSIVAYDHAMRSYQDFAATVFQQRQNILREVFVKMIDYKAANALLPTDSKNDQKAPVLFSNDKALLNEYFNDLLLYKRVINNQAVIVGKLKARATGLIKYFKSKYDLEE